jgi:hypothetical protein
MLTWDTATTANSHAMLRRCKPNDGRTRKCENTAFQSRALRPSEPKPTSPRKIYGAISRGAKNIDPAARKFASMTTETITEAKRRAKAKRA